MCSLLVLSVPFVVDIFAGGVGLVVLEGIAGNS